MHKQHRVYTGGRHRVISVGLKCFHFWQPMVGRVKVICALVLGEKTPNVLLLSLILYFLPTWPPVGCLAQLKPEGDCGCSWKQGVTLLALGLDCSGFLGGRFVSTTRCSLVNAASRLRGTEATPGALVPWRSKSGINQQGHLDRAGSRANRHHLQSGL